MIVKERDARDSVIRALERQASQSGDEVLKGGCRSAAARLRADPTTAGACAFIDHWFGDAEDWAVIHDLRLRVDGHAVQFNHVLISDAFEVVCLDTRYIDLGLEITDGGVYRTVGAGRGRPIASPVAALARNTRKLGTELRRAGLSRAGVLPGFSLRAELRGCVLVDPSLRSNAANGTERDAIGVFPRDALQTMFWKRERRRFPLAERLSPERLETLGRALAVRHRPCFPTTLLDADVATVDGPAEGLILAA